MESDSDGFSFNRKTKETGFKEEGIKKRITPNYLTYKSTKKGLVQCPSYLLICFMYTDSGYKGY